MCTPKNDNLTQQDILEQTQLALTRTQALYQVAHSLITLPNMPTLLQTVVDTIASVLPANRVTLITFDLETHQVTHFMKGGAGIKHVVEVAFDELWDGLSGWVLREMKAALSPKTIPDPRESLEVQRRRLETNCGSIIVAPLQYQNNILGTLTAINSPDEQDFTEHDVELMIAMANQSAIAIENAHLYKKLELSKVELEEQVTKRTTELIKTNKQLEQEIAERKNTEKSLHEINRAYQAISRCNQALLRATNETELLQEICHIIKDECEYNIVWIGFIEQREERNLVHLIAQAGFNEEHFEIIDPTASHIEREYDAVQDVIQNHHPIILRDVATNSHSTYSQDHIQQQEYKNVAVLPLLLKGQILGVLKVYSRQCGAFEANEIDLLMKLASDIAYGIATLREQIERTKITQALQASESRYRSLIESMNDGLTVINQDLVFTYTNPKFCDLLGFRAEELIGQPLKSLLDSTNTKIFEEQISKRVNGEQSIYELDWTTKDKERISTRIAGTPIFDSLGKFQGSFGVVADITERRRVEETLRQQNVYLTALYETTLAIMNRLNSEDLLINILNRAIALVGTAYGSIFLFSPDKTTLTAAIYTGYPKDLPLRNAQMGKGLAGTVWQTGNTVVINDYQHWHNRSFGVIPDMIRANLGIPLKSNDELIGILCVDYHEEGRTFSENDIATLTRFAALASIALDNAELYKAAQQELEERKRTEAALQRYNQRLKVLQDIDHYILTAHSPQIIANAVLEQLAQLIPCEFLSVILHNDDLTEERIFALRHTPEIGQYSQEVQPVVQNEVLETLKSGKTAVAPDLLQQAGSHARLALELESRGVRSALASPMIVHGKLIGTIALAAREVGFFTSEHQQIAEEVAAQVAIGIHQASLHEQIAQYNAQLEQRVYERTIQLENANRELELFSYSVSHDLRAPLRAIQGFSEIIARRHRSNLNEESSRYFDNIVTASQQMDQLINDLLEYVRLGRQQVRLRTIQLSDILTEIVDNLMPQVEKSAAQIHLASDLPTVLADKTLLKRIFTNLLENALMYHQMDIAPIIHISFAFEDNNVLVRVTDNGIGIQPEFREKIFDIFQRLHSQDQYPGTGIGLAIVRKSVEMLGGAVWVEAAPQQGSVFCIKLLRSLEKEL